MMRLLDVLLAPIIDGNQQALIFDWLLPLSPHIACKHSECYCPEQLAKRYLASHLEHNKRKV